MGGYELHLIKHRLYGRMGGYELHLIKHRLYGRMGGWTTLFILLNYSCQHNFLFTYSKIAIFTFASKCVRFLMYYY